MTTTHDSITVSNLTRTYAGAKKKKAFTAVDGISFHVREGEVYGLLGTNGAGKTSTLEILEGLAPATSGSLSVLGMHPTKDRAKVRAHTGTMLQSGGLPTQLTVAETIRMWAGTCSNPMAPDQALAAVDLTHRAKVKVGSLSGGEQRRLDLACALVGQPSILFLDEPTTGLDPESRRGVWALLEDLKARGVTMILTTHYLEEAERLCDRIGIMHRGNIVLEGSLRDIVATEASVIRFKVGEKPDATGASAELSLPALAGANVTRTGNTYEVRTDDLQDDALAVLQWAKSEGLSLTDFSATPASLETVFMRVAGEQR